MADMTREEALKIIESIGVSYCNECVKHDICNKCEINKAYTIIHQDIEKLSAYENADLIERSGIFETTGMSEDILLDFEELKKLINIQPRFEPKGSDE